MEQMSNQIPYPDSNINVYAKTQVQNIPGLRMQNNAGTNNLPVRADSLQRQWDNRDSPKGSNMITSHLYAEGQEGGHVSRSFYHGQTPDPKVYQGKLVSKETNVQSHEEDMEIGYEDKPTPLTYEILERKFQNEILKLIKEQNDVEDAENGRHMEKIVEINGQYREKLSWLRAQQAKRREDFLEKELLARLHQYQQVEIGHQQLINNNTVPNGHHGNRKRAAVEEPHQAYDTVGEFDRYSRREQPPFIGEGGRGQVTEGRVPYPPGRVYNKTGSMY